jgi:hypothetical protein
VGAWWVVVCVSCWKINGLLGSERDGSTVKLLPSESMKPEVLDDSGIPSLRWRRQEKGRNLGMRKRGVGDFFMFLLGMISTLPRVPRQFSSQTGFS